MSVMTIANSLVNTLLYIFIAVLVGGILTVLIILKSYKYKVTIRDIKDKNKFIITDRGKLVKDAKGNRWFKLLKLRRKEPYPPSDAILIGKRGKNHIDYYLTEDDVLIPIIDDFNFNEYKKKNDERIAKYLESTDKLDKVPELQGVYQPFTTNQRSLFINELVESEKYKKKTWRDLLTTAAPLMAIVLILVVFMIFYGDAVKPIAEIGDKVVAALDRAVEYEKTVKSETVTVLQEDSVPNSTKPPPN